MIEFARSSLAPFSALIFAASIGAAAASDEMAFPPRTATCLYQSPTGEKESQIVLYLSAFDSDGTAFYRALTAPPLEIKVLPDGKIATDPNPCRSELTFKD